MRITQTNLSEVKEQFKRLTAKLDEVREAKIKAESLHNELLYAVERVWPGETRHETALRYIREAEARSKVEAASQHRYGKL